MESISWARTQRRLTIFDRLATDEPGSLSSCSFSDLGDASYDINNNDQQMLSYYLSDYVQQFWPYMYEPNNNDSETTKRPLRLSSLLVASEKDSVRHFVGKNAALLACGVCQLLKEENGIWGLFGIGVICLIRDYNKRIFSLSLVDPTSDGSPAHSLWHTTLDRNFITMKSHSHLISFELPTGLFGLNFSKASEAEDFHGVVTTFRQEYLTKQSMRKPKTRRAPEPPSAQNEPIGHISEEITSSGIEIPVIVVKEEKKKRGMFQNIKTTLFGEKVENKEKKKKKSKTKPEISAPTNFQHLQHGLEEMSEDQKTMFTTIVELRKFKVAQGEEEQLHGLLKKAVIENYDDLKVELEQNRRREVEQKKEEPPMNRQENEHITFQRTTSNGLSETRDSLRMAKTIRGYTPRDLKKQSSVKKQENFDPFRANWDGEHQLPPTALAPSSLVEDAPPALSVRTHSRRNNLIRQNTPPYSRFGPPAETPPPSPPPRLESSHLPQRPPSPPAVKLAPISTSAPPPPPPPPSSLPKVNPSMAPPPPPPSVVRINVEPSSSTLNVPNMTDGRRSFLDEIQNVDKSKLLRPVDRSPSRTDVTPIGKGLGILDSIQRELDIRRTVLNSSSDNDSSDEEDSDSWSD